MGERRKPLTSILDAMYVDPVEENPVVAIRPNPARQPGSRSAKMEGDSRHWGLEHHLLRLNHRIGNNGAGANPSTIASMNHASPFPASRSILFLAILSTPWQ